MASLNGNDFLATDGLQQQSTAEPKRSTVGDILSQRRESLGYDLQTISQKLCIRKVYLRALEIGDFDEIPEGPYRVGYLKAYAKELLLDEKEMATLYREEVDGVPETPDLEFPVAVTEDRKPSSFIIISGVVLAGLVYLVWHFWLGTSAAPKDFTDLYKYISDQPVAEKQAMEEATTTEGLEKTITAVVSQPDTMVGQETSTDATPVEAEAETDDMAEVLATEVPTAPGTEGNDPTEAAPNLAKPSESQPETAEPTSTPLKEDVGTSEETEKVMDETAVAQPVADVRLVADQDSWLEIKNTQTDKILYTGILQQGQEYIVPNAARYVMRVGNAGGIKVFVQGKELNPLGRQGRVLSNISLSPTLLLQKYGQ